MTKYDKKYDKSMTKNDKKYDIKIIISILLNLNQVNNRRLPHHVLLASAVFSSSLVNLYANFVLF